MRPVLTVDVHAHVDVPAVADLVRDQPGLAAEQRDLRLTFGERSMAVNAELTRTRYGSAFGDTAVRLGWMDRARIDVQVVSVIPTLYHYWAPPGLADEIAQTATARVAEVVHAAPHRLVGLATVALQHPELAARQLSEAHRRPEIRGVEISTSAGGRELSDRALDPFWAAAEELGSFVFIHPWGCSLGTRLATAYFGNVVGNPTETTLALNHVVFGGVLDRFPRLRLCAAHGGGYFPHYLGRADHAFHVRPESRTMQRPPSAYLDSLWFDSLVHDRDVLSRLVAAVGHRQVVLGSDYPFDMAEDDPVGRLDELGLDPETRGAVAGGTAQSLLSPPGDDSRDDSSLPPTDHHPETSS